MATVELLAQPVQTSSPFLNDLGDVYITVVSNPVTLVFFVVGTIESLFLSAGLKNSIFGYFIDTINELLKTFTSGPIFSILTLALKIVSYVCKYRIYTVYALFAAIPVILSERSIYIGLSFFLSMILSIKLTYLERLILCNVWLSYSALNNFHKFILLLLITLFIYFETFTTGANSTLENAINAFVNSSLPGFFTASSC